MGNFSARLCGRRSRGFRERSPVNVLFLCTGNSARSILAEAIVNHRAQGRFTAYSAGSHPAGMVRPEALRLLERVGIASAGLRSKSWDEFAKPGAAKFDFVFTVCDNAAREACPVWPGQPITAHWGVADPAAVTGTPEEIEKAYFDACMVLERRIRLFLSLPMQALDRVALKRRVDEIGKQ